MTRQSPASDDQHLYDLVRQFDEVLARRADIESVAADASGLRPPAAAEFEQLCECVTFLELVHRQRAGQQDGVRLTDDVVSQNSDESRRIGRFQILGELGRGGCGVVFRAYDPDLGRDVALKVPRPEAIVSDELRQRFLREARAAGNVDHPHVVPIHEVGSDGPICYIAAAYVPGPTLAQWQRDTSTPVDPQQAAALVADLADALEAAHARGVVHRDMKPGNVLLQPLTEECSTARLSDYSARITDFGLAKLTETRESATRTGMVIGTPAYMAPEQAQGRLSEVGPATDVYAIGAILYELLVGQPPLRGESDADTLRRIVSDDPPLVRLSRPGISRDLEAIALKCLEKRPAQRYQTAAQLAADLRRFLSGQPTVARPIGTTARVSRWVRRRPAVAALVLVSLASLASLVTGSLIWSARLATALETAETERGRAQSEALNGRRLLYAAQVRLAYDAWQAQSPARTVELLERQIPGPGQADLREFAWHWLWAKCHAEIRSLSGHTDDVFAVAFSPDGETLATASKDGTARLWNPHTGSLRHTLRGHNDEVTCVRFSPDGAQLVTGSEDRSLQIWDTRTGQRQDQLDGHLDDILAVDFSADGSLIASGGRDRVIRIWNAVSRQEVRQLIDPTDTVRGVRFSRDGKSLVACDESGKVYHWHTDGWHKVAEKKVGNGQLFALDVSPDAQALVAVGRDSVLYHWRFTDAAPARHAASIARDNWVRDIKFDPSGRFAATCGHEGYVQFWNLEKPGKPPEAALHGHAGRVWSLDWSPDGRWLATAGADGTVKLWSARDAIVPAQFPAVAGSITDFGVAADSQTLVTASESGVIHRWELPSEGLPQSIQLEKLSEPVIAITADANKAAIGARQDARLRYLDLSTGKTLFEKDGFEGGINCLTMTAEETLLAVGTEGGKVELVELPSGHHRATLSHSSLLDGVAFSPDGRRLATCSRELSLWDVSSGKLIWRSRKYETSPRRAVFSPDGQLIATVMSTNLIVLVDAATGNTHGTLVFEQGRARCAAFSPDGATLAVGVGLGTVRIWDVRTRQELSVWETGLGRLFSAKFSPDGRSLLAVGHAVAGPDSTSNAGSVVIRRIAEK